MGYVSLHEDLVNKFNDLNSRIEKSSKKNIGKRKKVIMRRLTKDEFNSILEDYRYARRELKEKNSIVSDIEMEIKLFKKKFSEMEHCLRELQNDNESLTASLSEKVALLDFLKSEISDILKKNEQARKEAQIQNQERLIQTVNSINSTNAEVVLDMKAGIKRIAHILNQPNFFKKSENLNNLKHIIHRLNEI